MKEAKIRFRSLLVEAILYDTVLSQMCLQIQANERHGFPAYFKRIGT